MPVPHLSRSTGGARPAARFLLALAVAIVGLVGLAGPASAHHPEITGSIDCAGTVTFTATAWATNDPASRTNPDIRVHRSTDGGATYGTLVGQGSFSQSNGYTFSGSFTTTGTDPVLLRVKAFANWANGASPGEPRYVTLMPPTNCPVVAPAAGSISHTCTAYSVVLDNRASNVPVTYTITHNGVSQQVTVPGGTSVTHTGAVGEDTTNTVSVSAGGNVLATATFTVDCTAPTPPPTPTPTPTPAPAPIPEPEVLPGSAGLAVGNLKVGCQGTVRVIMRNRSDERAVYTVRIAKRERKLGVASGATRTWVTSASPRQRATLMLGGKVLASKRLPRACVAPEVLPATGLRR
jgi:hypothetical protein